MAGPGSSGRAGTLAAGAALQDDDRRLVQPLGAAAGCAQLAQVGVGVGVAAAHRLAAGAHAEAGLRAPPHGGRGRHPEGHHALQPLAARTLLQAARRPLGRAAHLAAAARVADAAAFAVSRRRLAARGLAAFRAPGGRRRRASGPGRLRLGGRREEQQQEREARGARGLHGGSDGSGGGLGEDRRAAPGRAREGLGRAGASARDRAAQPIGLAAVTSRLGDGHGGRGGEGGGAGRMAGGRAAGAGTARGGGRAGAPGHGAAGGARAGRRAGPPSRGAGAPGLRVSLLRRSRVLSRPSRAKN